MSLIPQWGKYDIESIETDEPSFLFKTKVW